MFLFPFTFIMLYFYTKALMNKVSSNIKVKVFLQFSTANLSFLLFSNALPPLPPRNCNFPPVEPLMKNSFLRSRSRYPWSFHDSNFQALRPLKFIIIKKVKSQDKKTEGKIISENETVVILGFFFSDRTFYS